MKILSQTKTGNQVVIQIEEEYTKFEPCIEKAYQEASREVKIPGFRQGKVPSEVMKKYIDEAAVVDRAVQILVGGIYPSVLEEAKIKPVDYPVVEIKKLEKGNPLAIEIKVDVYPEIKLGNYKGLKAKKQDASVTDADVDGTLEYVRKNYAKENKLADADVKIDDDFAKNISRMNSIAELKVLIRSNIEEEKKHESDMALRDEITRQLAEAVQVDLPKGMIDREVDNMVSDLEISLKRSNMTMQSYLSAVKKDVQKLKEEMSPAAQTRIKAKLALEAISDKEKLVADEEDMNKEIENLATHYGKTAEEYKAQMSPEIIDSIKDYLLKEKAIDFVISKAKVEG